MPWSPVGTTQSHVTPHSQTTLMCPGLCDGFYMSHPPAKDKIHMHSTCTHTEEVAQRATCSRHVHKSTEPTHTKKSHIELPWAEPKQGILKFISLGHEIPCTHRALGGQGVKHTAAFLSEGAITPIFLVSGNGHC